ncbi:MAG: hypothetical protein WKG32_16210 [Gemmatimonadaceae bacterium]
MRRLTIAALVLLAVVAPTACRSGQPSTDQRETPLSRATVRVENQSSFDMNIYVLRSSERIRLGTTTANSTSTYVLPAYLVSSTITLRFLADPIGANRTPVSEEIAVRPGEQVRLTIPPR